MDLQGKTAFVTGGSGDIGGAIARAVAAAGADVAVSYVGHSGGPYLFARACAPHLRAHGSGRIVNIASVGGLSPASSGLAYSASKAGLIQLSPAWPSPSPPDVTVNCIAPGLVEGTRMARTGSAGDIAEQVPTFCRADSVSGRALVIDGGMPVSMH